MDASRSQNCPLEGPRWARPLPIVQGFSLEEFLAASEPGTARAQQAPLNSAVAK